MATLDKIRLSGTTYDIIDSTAVHSLDGYWTTGETTNAITAATNALAESIAEMNYATTGYVQEAIAEASGVTTGQVQTMIDESVSGKANSADVITEVGINSTNDSGYKIVQLTQKKGGVAQTNKAIVAFDEGTFSATSYGNTYAIKVNTNTIAQKSDIPSVTGYADSVKYDSTAQEVKFYHGGTGGTEVFSFDASPFLIDGMIESVVITSITSGTSEVEVLEITWNSAAGGQVTDIPLSEIFDASNYYTTAQTNSAIEAATSGKADTTAVTQAISEAVSGKADTTAVTQSITEATSGKADTSTVEGINNTLTAHTADTTIHVTSSDKTTWSGKQDALVSGTNIKTVGGESLLGSGNIAFPTGLQVEVSGTTLVFS